MTAGLQIWDGSGRLLLDATSRSGRVLGMSYIDGSGNPGSVSADLSSGTPFWCFQPDFMIKNIYNNAPPPLVSMSSTGVSWNYSGSGGGGYAPVSGWLIYGVY
ncbi:TPA: hypothetical protein QDA71_004278 [Burkholderia vietnamiensis]|nr:hypothetical protein [Burkholderia vietnamiensis]HDR9210001.1 hypothetical protein [Burkholderia vietnamiensis]